MKDVRKRLSLWGLSFLAVFCVHLGLALWALFGRPKPPPLVLPPEAPVMLAELAPPPPPPPAPTPVVTQTQEEPEVPKLAEAAKPALAVAKPKPKPPKEAPKKPEPKKEQKKPEPAKPQVEPQPAKATPQTTPSKSTADSDSKSTSNSQNYAKNSSATAAGSGSGRGTGSGMGLSQARASWQSLLLGRLAQYKHYPEAAKQFEEPGVKRMNRLRFVIDATGKVLSYELIKLSGNDLLDQATLEMIRKAQPLPAPPPELLTNGTLEVIAPVVYELK